MVNLYVDDLRMPPEGWTVCRSIACAKEYLKLGHIDKLSLDHDMGAGDRKDGTALVLWMIDTGHWSRQKPTIHSMNPVGRERMNALIERYWDERTVR